jgi:sarcosine oxidase subunit beta
VRIIVIGGGISGLFIAYELLKRGIRDIIVIEEKYLSAGGSGRNIGCFRSSFTSPEHVILMKRSIELWLNYRSELGLELKQSGYLWIARKPETLEIFEKLSVFHRNYGIPTRVLSIDEVEHVQPGLNKDIIAGALFDPTAGRMPIFENLVKLYLKLKTLGVIFHFYTKAIRLNSSGYRIKSAITSKGEIYGDIFIVSAGGKGTRELLATVNIEFPVIDETRHPIITEPYAEILKPALIIDWDTPGAPYVTQTEHGGIIFARNIADIPEALLTSHRIDVIGLTIKPIIELLPILKYVNILRYWIGYYETTPDHHPIYGPIYPYENLYVAAGFSGHGLMMGPITGLLIADWVLNGKPSIPIAENLTLERFKIGKLVKEIAIVG